MTNLVLHDLDQEAYQVVMIQYLEVAFHDPSLHQEAYLVAYLEEAYQEHLYRKK